MLSLTHVLKLSIVIHYENSQKTTTFDEAIEERKAIHLMYYEAKPGRPAQYDLIHQISTTQKAVERPNFNQKTWWQSRHRSSTWPKLSILMRITKTETKNLCENLVKSPWQHVTLSILWYRSAKMPNSANWQQAHILLLSLWYQRNSFWTWSKMLKKVTVGYAVQNTDGFGKLTMTGIGVPKIKSSC